MFTPDGTVRPDMQWNPVLAFWAAVVALIYLLFVLHELRTRAGDTE